VRSSSLLRVGQSQDFIDDFVNCSADDRLDNRPSVSEQMDCPLVNLIKGPPSFEFWN
jgi:hypothetical protein